jgi:hypothetical protein
MTELQLLSKSIVLVQAKQVTYNPFQKLCNEIMLMSIINKVTGLVIKPSINITNPNEPRFIFEDIIFQFYLSPARLVIQHNTYDYSSDKLQKILEDIFIKISEIKIINTIGAVGINFEFFIEEKINDKIFQPLMGIGLKNANILSTYEIHEFCQLNLSIADAVRNKITGNWIRANYHVIMGAKKLEDFVKDEICYLDEIKNRLNKLLN